MIKLPIVEKLSAELKKLDRELRIDIPKELRTAAAHGDLKENAEYHAAKQRQSFLEARVAQLGTRINALSSLKLEDLPKDAVGFGSKVSLEDLNSGDKVVFEIVAPDEVNPKVGKISVGSPIGQALLNKKEDDDVTINLPTGVKEYGIVKIETIHELLLKSDD